MTPTRLVLGLALLAGACTGGGLDEVDASVDADMEDRDSSIEDRDSSIDEEQVCDAGCWVRRCREVSYASGSPSGPLDVGEMRDGSYVPYTDGGQATLVFGFQGGVMIEPVVRVPADMIGSDDCVQITVRNRPDPAYPELAGELESFTHTEFIDPLRPDASGVYTATVLDQVGWMTVPELRMILEVEARGVDWVRSAELALHVVDADGLDMCDVVPRQSRFGCELAVLTGALTVDAVDELEGVACDDTVDVTVTLDPELEVPEECVELTRTVAVTRGCVESEGYAAGTALGETTWELDSDPSRACADPSLGLVTSGCSCL